MLVQAIYRAQNGSPCNSARETRRRKPIRTGDGPKRPLPTRKRRTMSPRQLAALKRQMELAKRRRTGGGKTIRPGQRTSEQMARLKKVMGELGKTRSRPARPTRRLTAQQRARLAAQRRAAQQPRRARAALSFVLYYLRAVSAPIAPAPIP